MSKWWQPLAWLWNGPNTLVGLLMGVSGYLVGWLGYAVGRMALRPSVGLGHNAIEFHNLPWPWMMPLWGLTLGHVILYGRSPFRAPLAELIGAHEEAHTRQGEILGPLYLPFHAASILVGLWLDGSMYGPHAFGERGPLREPPRPF